MLCICSSGGTGVCGSLSGLVVAVDLGPGRTGRLFVTGCSELPRRPGASVVAVGSAAAAVLGPTVLVGAGVCICERRVCCWACVDTRGGFEVVAWAMVTLVVVMVPYM